MKKQAPTLMDINQIYQELVGEVLSNGTERETRSGACKAVFGASYKVDLGYGFPILSSKKINFNNVMHELNWFLRGETNINSLKAPRLWKDWADESGELGPIYGYQWRHWEGAREDCYGRSQEYDQIRILIRGLKEDPYSRRHIVTAWNVEDVECQALPPCHAFFQCFVREAPGPGLLNRQQVKYLDLQLYQRSGDLAIGVPYNMASYGLLLTMLAREVNMVPGVFHHTFGDLHAYSDHIEGLQRQISRLCTAQVRIKINPEKSLWDLVEEDDPLNYTLENYDPAPFISFKVHI